MCQNWAASSGSQNVGAVGTQGGWWGRGDRTPSPGMMGSEALPALCPPPQRKYQLSSKIPQASPPQETQGLHAGEAGGSCRADRWPDLCAERACRQLGPTPCNPVVCSPPGSSVYRVSPGKNTGVGYHALLLGIFPAQGLNPGLPHCWRILYYLSQCSLF